MLDRVFSYKRSDSWVNQRRRNRFLDFMAWVDSLGMSLPIRILDLGGTYPYWKRLRHEFSNRFQITLMNLSLSLIPEGEDWIRSVRGDVREMDSGVIQEHDVLFSNSLIEHLGSREAMRQFADRIVKSGKPYYVQTPSFWFPLEPHCRIPCFQFLPRNLRAHLIWHFNVNYFPAAETLESCKRVSDSTILLTRKELKDYFPQARIATESLLAMPKSYVVYGAAGRNCK